MRIHLAMDPETRRVAAQARPFTVDDLPRGLRGEGWSIRETEIPDDEWQAMLTGALTGDKVDALHRDAWTAAGPTAWPEP